MNQTPLKEHLYDNLSVILPDGMGMSFRVLRFVSMFTAATLGLYGIVLFMLVLLTHLTRQKSFGTPYFSPDFVFSYKNEDNSIILLPLKNQKKGERYGQS
ncbi:spore gernimation protein [Bacillus safensis FO-36b] [Bacillus safensis subsp. safensis]